MKLLLTGTVVILVFLSALNGYSQIRQNSSDVPGLKDWISVEPYKAWSSEWYCAASSRSDWRVIRDKDEILVTKAVKTSESRFQFPFNVNDMGKDFYDRSVVKVSDGWIVAYDGGEWGGEIQWFSKDGKNRYKISENRVLDFINIQNHLYALSGLAHKMLSEGYLLKLGKDENNKWTASIMADLKDAPYTYLKDSDNSLLVVTSENLFRVYLSGKITLLHRGTWKGLYPNSVAVHPEGTVYIGMRYAVAVLIPNGTIYKEKWLVSPKCRYFRQVKSKESECECIPVSDTDG